MRLIVAVSFGCWNAACSRLCLAYFKWLQFWVFEAAADLDDAADLDATAVVVNEVVDC